MKTDYCTASPDKLFGFTTKFCCKKHDNMVGQAGTYNPITPHISFFVCLFKLTVLEPKNWFMKLIGLVITIIYTVFGAIFSWIKYPWLAYSIYQYRKANR